MGSSDSDDSTQSQRIRPIPITVPPRAGSPTSSQRTPDAVIGELIGEHFRVTEVLGYGGMGAVFGVEELATGQPYALKLLRRAALSGENRNRFRREVSAAARVRHRHLVRMRAHGMHRGSPYLVMERLEGETLQARIRRDGVVPPMEACTITLQLLDALGTVHESGFLHRDVKPSNVFLCATDLGAPPDIRLIDFGLARVLRSGARQATQASEDSTGLTATGVIPGTPAYLAPEQVFGVKDLDQRVDVWAAGLTLYEMLFGHRAFMSGVFDDLVREIVQRPVTIPTHPAMPADLDALLRQALARDRQERFATARAFHVALASVVARYATRTPSR